MFGIKFKSVTDHKPSLYVMNIKDPGSQITRFRLKFEEYDFEDIHKSGKNNTNAVDMSRTIFKTSDTLITSYQEF